jgi:CRISPR-associated endonuclease/helicase Cas3
MKEQFYAHSREGKPPEEWHRLEDHLVQVAELARKFAERFHAGDWGYLAGLWHDLGKFLSAFQSFIHKVGGLDAHLEGKPDRVDHSSAGAIQAVQALGFRGRVLAYPIAGHHAGLPDWQSPDAGMAALSQRLARGRQLEKKEASGIPPSLLNHTLPTERPKAGTELSLSLWMRMLFSCLVDADFLDTEAFFEPGKPETRKGYPKLPELLSVFHQYMEDKKAKLGEAGKTAVNRIRDDILSRCREMAFHQPGIFTLTVPTGGGKTLSSLAFALQHAATYGKDRIIYVIPYTSIIEQTADQFRDAFRNAGEAVLEHHSNLDATDETKETPRSRLACENWDAPIIVTTSVQFFESLFASRTSRCRKLHNIVNSVIILDEAQLLPPDFLKPILEALKELRKNYGVTVVFCTATQPALGPHKAVDFDFAGIPDMKEIVDDPAALHQKLKRTAVRKVRNLEPISWEDVAEELRQHDSVLCVVNRRDDARTLWQIMPGGTFHLSGLMCGSHRAEKIAEVKRRLKDKIPTRVISTHLVEAGVDVDFPVVYRAAAGLDSIAQAAGRCNREGLLDCGEVFVFVPPSKTPAGHLRQAAEIGRRLLVSGADDPLSPDRFEAFFREFYWVRGPRLDARGIIMDLANHPQLEINFRTAARNFRLIDETSQAPVIVRYHNEDLLDILERRELERWLLSRLQRSVVNLPRYLHKRLLDEGAIREVHPGVFVQGHGALYHKDLGFCPDKSVLYEPDELIC